MNKNTRWKTFLRPPAFPAVFTLCLFAGGAIALAADTTKVVGSVTDPQGKPIAGVKIHFEHAKISGKKAKPVKTNRKGNFSMPFLDIGSGPEWRAIAEFPDYVTLRVRWLNVDSEGNTRDEGERVLDENQEFPEIRFAPIGKTVVSSGKNEVHFTLVPKSEFSSILAQLKKKQAKGTFSEEELQAQQAAEKKRKKQEIGYQAFEEGVSLARQGRHEEAVENLRVFLEMDPEHETGHYELAKNLQEMKNFEEAEIEFRKALELNSDYAGAHFHLGLMYANQERYPEAQVEFREELERTPDDPTVMFNLALVFSEQGKIAEAIPWFEKVSVVQPDNSEIYWKLAKLYEEQGNKEKANLQYEKFALANPEEADVAFYNIGSEAFNQRNREEAAIAFRKALEVNPNHADSHRQLGYCLVGMGEFDAAVQHFRKFLELRPNSPLAPEIRQTIAQLSG